MSTFRTDVSPSQSIDKITLQSPVFTAGSCFADAIGERLALNKFTVQVNPFGVTYNPLSIHKTISYGIVNTPVPEHTHLVSQGVHLNYDFHSEISSLDKSTLIFRLNNIIARTHAFLRSASWIMITYGTAWVYERIDTGEVVANCHKMPAAHFRKRLLSHDEITQSFDSFYAMLKKYNPRVKVILTLSPVRHIKDTLELNSVSKSVLRVACHTLAGSHAGVSYFPAYEMMMDDLRDYRFYKSDMLHPTEEAEDYIWTKFAACYFDDATVNFIRQWQPLLAALRHKPFHPSSAAHQQFLRETLARFEALEGIVNIEQEIKIIKNQLLQ